ncbi:hypothetical protein OWV82_024272 [Melia azedarach]|uniref:Uncharacterized protein n=1 Tax=Melia azedarach TaxID=155640 RepID=A0ACC1WP82_MELAZ|nr:hypothetical protein OWV82_024272 [Melia azedarach]
MGWNLHSSWQDPDKCSRVSLTNRVLLSVLERKTIHDEQFKLEVVSGIKEGTMLVTTIAEFFKARKTHYQKGYVAMKLMLEILPFAVLSLVRRILFSENNDHKDFVETNEHDTSEQHHPTPFHSLTQLQAALVPKPLTPHESFECTKILLLMLK